MMDRPIEYHMVRIDFLAWETKAWVEGVRDFLQMLSAAIDDASVKEKVALEGFARASDMDPAEYLSELQTLDHKFQRWLPRVSSYSAVILLHSLVETQLLEYAARLRRHHELRIGVRDLAGKGVDAAKVYITKVAAVDIANDLGWLELKNLQELRNIIVHRRGRQGGSPEQQKTVKRLLDEYKEDISLTDRANVEDCEVEISLRLCFHFVTEVDQFFQRLCLASGFQERAWKS